MTTGSEEFVVDGLDHPVQVIIDRWGVPHIFAESRLDAFVAQGFNAARDRLFQIDLSRRRGLGCLAEVFGPAYIEQDRAARLFLYRGDMHSEWLAYGSDVKAIATAFVLGINSYVSLCEADPTLLPPEFKALGYAPAHWRPDDVARIRSHGLYHNVDQEVARARTLARYGARVEDLRRIREPAVDLTVPEGLDLSCIPSSVLDVYMLAVSPVVFGDGAGLVSSSPSAGPEGSNNWVISGSRTATGRPLLANDPHRAVTLPSLRYLAHLNAPGLNVIGAGEPGLPGISIGHNERVAFGLTIFPIDQEDLYVYDTHADFGWKYRYQNEWEPMERVVEQIDVAGSAAVDVELSFTRHGPVIHEDQQNHRAFALRAAWLEPGMAPYLGSLEYMGARSAEEMRTALARWGSPGENQVYADVDGNIGWTPAGLVPVRPNWDGTLPVPGDGRYEWSGFYDADELPSVANPMQGWISTANEMNLPSDFSNAERTISYDWYPRYRQQRITDVLSAIDKVSVEDCARLQADYVSLPAQEILRSLEGMTWTDGQVSWAVELLSQWDCSLAPDSPAAALFEIWYRRHLRPALLSNALAVFLEADQVAEALTSILPAEHDGSDPRVDLALLTDIRLGARALQPGVLERSLAAAVAETEALLGRDRSVWKWGSLHRSHLVHPMAPILSRESPWTIGPAPRGGSGDTIGAASYTNDFVQAVGATFRIVMDVGAWDNSVAMNSPGQSGHPNSPHYADLFEDWANDRTFPLLYSREAAENHAESRYILLPEFGTVRPTR